MGFDIDKARGNDFTGGIDCFRTTGRDIIPDLNYTTTFNSNIGTNWFSPCAINYSSITYDD
jgi:hypothetical protein